MGLIETEIMELRKLAKDVLDGKMKPEQAAIQLTIYNQVAKREQLILNSIGLAAKHGAKIWTKLINKNLITDNSAISVDGNTTQQIVCPERGGILVDIEDCLSHSGTDRNIDACQKCDNFSTVRKIVFNT